MKNLKLIPTMALFVMTLFIATSCSDDDEGASVPVIESITEIATDSQNLTTFAAAVQRADLTAVLNGSDKFTVLAPTNDAFDAFLQANNFNSLQDVPVDVLRQVLLYHVLAGTLTTSSLSPGYISTSATKGGADDLKNLSMLVSTDNGIILNGTASIDNLNANISATNGLIHSIDAVLSLPTIADHASINPELANLVEALTFVDTQLGEDSNLVETFSSASENGFTVFAPVNDAFADLISSINPETDTFDELTQTIEDIEDEEERDELAEELGTTVRDVLLTHVIDGEIPFSSLSTSDLTTLEGSELSHDAINATISDTEGNTNDITVFDIEATNGTIHVIDGTLAPSTDE
jgi:uncharacterized surface protein with fasciclin (FAS1) repeats